MHDYCYSQHVEIILYSMKRVWKYECVEFQNEKMRDNPSYLLKIP